MDLSLRDRIREDLHRVVELAPNAFVMTDPEGRIVFVNTRAETLFGYRREDLIGEPVEMLMPERLRAGHRQDRGHYMASPQARPMGAGRDLWAKRKDGSVLPVEIGLSPISTDQGTMVLASIVDISQRKRAEEALRESEEQFRTFFESAAVGAVQVDPVTGRFLATNERFCRVTGYRGEELAAMAFWDITHPEDRPWDREQLGRLLRGESSEYDLEKRCVRKDGGIIWVRVWAAMIRDAAGRPLRTAGIVQDITDRKRAEAALQAAVASAERAKAVAEQANRTKDHFLAVLSHELRTPLTPAMMGVSILQNKPDLDPAIRETLETVRRNVEMEARLIDDLLDMTRIARGKIELRKQRIDLNPILQHAVDVCRPDIEARGLHFGMDLRSPTPCWIEADPARLQQVFWNLLKNAVKFTPQGGCVGIRVSTDGGLKRKDEGSRMRDEGSKMRDEGDPSSLIPHPSSSIPHPSSFIMVEVNDSGIGISPEALSRIFNAFEQAERSITRQFGGLGLGLAISKALVEMHGGKIEAHSEGRDRGATFRLWLPMAAPVPRPEAPAAAPRQRAVRPLRILLVEDHGITAKMMRWVLSQEGHQVETAGDVATALELAGRQPFDLLLSDLGLPDASGHDLMRQLRQRGHRFAGIALSGYGQEEDIQHSREAGFAAHLTKPASRERLLEAVASVAGEPPAMHQ